QGPGQYIRAELRQRGIWASHDRACLSQCTRIFRKAPVPKKRIVGQANRIRETHVSEDFLSGTTRRTLLSGAASAAAMFGGLASLPALAANQQIAGHDPSLMVPSSKLGEWLQQLHKFGPVRNTGTAPCR